MKDAHYQLKQSLLIIIIESAVKFIPPFFSLGALQLLTQGSADVVLDACSDYWDGTCICPITAFER